MIGKEIVVSQLLAQLGKSFPHLLLIACPKNLSAGFICKPLQDFILWGGLVWPRVSMQDNHRYIATESVFNELVWLQATAIVFAVRQEDQDSAAGALRIMLHHLSTAKIHGIVHGCAAGETKVVNSRRKRFGIGGEILAQRRFMIEP